MLQELEQMTVKSEATHRELAGAREEASILRIRVGELEQQVYSRPLYLFLLTSGSRLLVTGRSTNPYLRKLLRVLNTRPTL